MNKTIYQSPEIEIIEVEIEKGFAASQENPLLDPPQPW